MPVIDRLSALEILDSRGQPTVLGRCRLTDGSCASASVPSGASTGRGEAVELRDGEPNRYRGRGCRQAAGGINREIHEQLHGHEFSSQAELDRALIELDGTPDKSRLGANAILAVSLAFARAEARARQIPLYRHFAHLLDGTDALGCRLPRLTTNLFSGGKHAGGQIPIQDVLLVPLSARTIDESLAAIYAVYQAAAEITSKKYGTRALTADEGGLAPPFPSVEAMLEDAVAAIEAAGLEPGRQMALAIDVASSHFYRDGRYHLSTDPAAKPLESVQMIEVLNRWVERYPIISVEDGLAEEDWAHWPRLKQALGGRALVVGDDLLCTHPARIGRAIEANAADTLLLKVNQIGTLSEAAEACRLARSAGWAVIVSARSGETEDDWLADLAIGFAGDQIKVGSITQSERLAKYNRLLGIEAEDSLPLAPWPKPLRPPPPG